MQTEMDEVRVSHNWTFLGRGAGPVAMNLFELLLHEEFKAMENLLVQKPNFSTFGLL